MNSFTLTAIPLFILMAEILQESKLSLRVYHRAVQAGVVDSRRAVADEYCGVRDLCGDQPVRASSPRRRSGGWRSPNCRANALRPALSAGSLAAGGTLGILIPPSIAMIVYGTFTETSVAEAVHGGGDAGFAADRRCSWPTSRYMPGSNRLSRRLKEARSRCKELIAALSLDVFPFVVLIRWNDRQHLHRPGPRRRKLRRSAACSRSWSLRCSGGNSTSVCPLVHALQTTTRVCGNILFLIVYAAFLFSYAISYAGVGEQITQFLVNLKLSKLEFFLALFVLYTVLGCLVESLGMIVVTVPLLFPVLLHYGIDPIRFGVILVLFIEMGQISPPIGINLFVIQSIWNGKLSDVVMGTIPFHLIMFVLLGLLVIYSP